MKKSFFTYQDGEQDPKHDQLLLKLIYKAMMYVAREEEITVEDKFYKLEDQILTYEELDVTDMIDNLEHVYFMIDKTFYEEMDDEGESEDE